MSPTCDACEDRIEACADCEQMLEIAVSTKDWSYVQQLKDTLADKRIRRNAVRCRK